MPITTSTELTEFLYTFCRKKCITPFGPPLLAPGAHAPLPVPTPTVIQQQQGGHSLN